MAPVFGSCMLQFSANNLKFIKAAKNVFSGLFHIRGNNNYSIIELFDTYLMESCRKKASDLYSSLESNERTNLTNEPFCAQENEIINKAGQNLFKGETVEVFCKSFTIALLTTLQLLMLICLIML